ncbi:hypothetical protein QO010_001734 [Caulobacter ginsengisoli]|uniref:HTH LytTR-type domain-containing protein n=1 Tax=Caulobacter ginsengisoli TaxID=400775 RepID=A0ABU0IS31_9CAUL|nr:LytTR family DNA-binding domain-containing protein [Caulobacter ginsengisoli]MDQ0463963.1 hypothetical protein [Caulobacter ginsengisoli]
MDGEALAKLWKLGSPAGRRLAAELGVLAAMGLLVAVLGPFGSDFLPAPVRFAYWLACIVGGGLIGIGLDRLIGRRLTPLWWRVLAISLLMTAPVTLYVVGCIAVIRGESVQPGASLNLLWQVFALSLPVMAVRALVWRRGPTRVETRTIIEPPLPEAEAVFRRRLSARRRSARLLALEAEDHYLRVYTDAGAELLTLRLSDALAELARAHGYQVHRSWWISAEAIEAVTWKRGRGEARLAGGLTVPVSRTHAPVLREAGWT